MDDKLERSSSLRIRKDSCPLGSAIGRNDQKDPTAQPAIRRAATQETLEGDLELARQAGGRPVPGTDLVA